ncbi:uncharacterized protein MONOS_9293 [Monocercomonoides exilis]|uniref:uncharacterized protein n=1 Tax=Monocercomonoides exilis TaxID=2049356 RepID=UPI00355A27D3|nr:hypothetical protein MONOS_9293 [Monocercomonoides exilis]|eukprot:MONOS_9293.1-p1 / transcript=MONOS_9293.1 / gene=MONOS_9293 / organism=Monocercomonoides_exilis_PA203 / gene_product=unspecified product / transcript_product=unspecified product / location=Mono_scaffold00377:41286-41957(-) / protein_length=224 / sequence_SO=supercontig / SO=protein_coding / is_pseudo=false
MPPKTINKRPSLSPKSSPPSSQKANQNSKQPHQSPTRPKQKATATKPPPKKATSSSPPPKVEQNAQVSKAKQKIPSHGSSPKTPSRQPRQLQQEDYDPLLAGKHPPKPEELLTLYHPTTNFDTTGIYRINALMKGTTTNLSIKMFRDTTPMNWITFFILFTTAMIIFVISMYVIILEIDNDAVAKKTTATSVGTLFLGWINSQVFVGFAICLSFSLLGWAIAV